MLCRVQPFFHSVLLELFLYAQSKIRLFLQDRIPFIFLNLRQGSLHMRLKKTTLIYFVICSASLQSLLALGLMNPGCLSSGPVKPLPFSTDTTSKKDSANVSEIKYRKLILGTNYASNSTFMGRKDSVSRSTFSPSVMYEGIKGWNGALIASHTGLSAGRNKKGGLGRTAKTPLLDELDGVAGWDHDFGEVFSTTVSNTHSYFDSKSARIRSVIDNDLNVGIQSDWDYIIAAVSGDLDHGVKSKLGKGRDYFLTFSLSHEFGVLINASSDFKIEPRFNLIAGTQNFYLIYTKGKPLDSTLVSKREYPKQLAKFALLNYEVSLPLTYTKKSWAFDFSWNYNIPQNIIGGASSAPFSVFMADIKFIIRGKGVLIPKKKISKK